MTSLNIRSKFIASQFRKLTTAPGLLYEVRVYQCQPSAFKEFMGICSSDDFSERLKASMPYGSWRTEMGTLNQIFHIWPHTSVANRAEVRNELAKNERWMSLYPKLAATWEWQTSHLCQSLGPVESAPAYQPGFYYYIYSKNYMNKFVKGFTIPKEYSSKVALMGQFRTVLGNPVGSIYSVLNCDSLDAGFEVLSANSEVLEQTDSQTSLIYPLDISPLK